MTSPTSSTSGTRDGDWKSQFTASQGNSGIAVQGYSPTSIKGWSKIKSVLRDANVSEGMHAGLHQLDVLWDNTDTFVE